MVLRPFTSIQVDRIMSYLFVKKLYLWPRFHLAVGKELEGTPPEAQPTTICSLFLLSNMLC